MTIKIRALVNSPLEPLSIRMLELSKRAEEFRVATAFLSAEAVYDIIKPALRAGTTTRLLTGTFGHQTRRATFKQLLAISQRNEDLRVRIWDCGRHRDLHVKIYLWRMPSKRGFAWLGSANMTVGGLQKEGELVFEFQGPWDGAVLQAVRAAFNREWLRGSSLDAPFVATYRESERRAPDMRSATGRRKGSLKQLRSRSKFFVTFVGRHYAENSPIAERTNSLLGGVPDPWIRHRTKMLTRVRKGDGCLVVDRISRSVEIGRVSDVKREGRWHIFAYQPLLPGDGFVRWTRSTARALREAGIRAPYPRGPRAQWIDPGKAEKIRATLRSLARRH